MIICLSSRPLLDHESHQCCELKGVSVVYVPPFPWISVLLKKLTVLSAFMEP
jgi:hypothetical protein